MSANMGALGARGKVYKSMKCPQLPVGSCGAMAQGIGGLAPWCGQPGGQGGLAPCCSTRHSTGHPTWWGTQGHTRGPINSLNLSPPLHPTSGYPHSTLHMVQMLGSTLGEGLGAPLGRECPSPQYGASYQIAKRICSATTCSLQL